MKVSLYDKVSMKLPDFPNHKDRIEYLENNIFNCDKYNSYYGFISDDLIKDDYKDIENRWIGIKKVGSPNRYEHTKSFLNILGSYILNANEYSIKKVKKKYIKLQDKYNSKCINLTESELLLLSSLRPFVKFYENKGNSITIFMINPLIKEFMKKRLNNIKNNLNKNKYKNEVLLKSFQRISNCLNVIENSEITCNLLIKSLEENNKKIKNIKDMISDYYKNPSEILNIKSLIQQYKKLVDDNKYIKFKINELDDAYFVSTEFIYSAR